MTSRLKHKLELEQINVKSAYLNESFVQIGTPLPALAETRKDKLEYVPEWQQEVRDEKGRRRFHGAFEGGFSAGYYNTVGSKEGWTPAEFKSSRNNRANKVQRPEDFMDDEDLAQMKEDRTLENTETFRSDRIGSTKAELENRTIPSALQSLIEPARTSIGQQLLQKQGWRPGQGIGPRVTLPKLKMQEAKAGPSPRPIIDDEDDEMTGHEAHGAKHLYAPRDTKFVVYEQKEEKQGLGYVRGMGKGLDRSRALNIRANHVDIGDDEDDPYSAPGPSSSSRAFAFAGEDEDEPVVIGGPSRSAVPSYTSASDRSRSDLDTSRWHDGRPVLPGFELDPLGVPAEKWFEMPDIPPDWRPRPARVWGSGKKWDETPDTMKEEKELVRGTPGKPLTFEQRGEALGEEAHQSKAKSVFEYMSEKDRERIQAIAAAARAGATAPPPLSMTDPSDSSVAETATRPTEVFIPPLSPRTAGAALRGFIPYGDDPAKQDRYRSYLSSQTLHSKTPYPELRTGTIDEINKELDDFAGSARIFKPMSFAMSSRFTSGSASLANSDMKQAKPGLHLFDAEKAALAVEAAKKINAAGRAEVQKPLTPREQAAADGRYGLLTRIVKEFYPVKLVCRRFGVQDPHPEGEPKNVTSGGSGSGGVTTPYDDMPLPKNDSSWQDAFIHQASVSSASSDIHSTAAAAAGTEEGERQPKTLAEVGMADDINQGRDTLTYTKPSIDIFKAIFASDEESSDEEEPESVPPKAATGQSESNGNGSSLVRPKDKTPADLATFKPVFQVKREREEPEIAASPAAPNGKTDGERGKEKAKDKEKRRKKDKKPKGVLSFHVDEGEDDGGTARERGNGELRGMERVVRQPQGDRQGHNNRDRLPIERQEVEQEEWVERAPSVASAPPRPGVRKGAADFM